jgi:hypothetical protein
MLAFYDKKPSVLEAVGNGSYRYRYNIEEEIPEVKDENASETNRSQWKCQEVTVWLPLSSNGITEAVISDKWENNYEQKLVNEYNAVQLGIITGEEAEERVAAYKAFLTARAALKAQVDADCEELGIR